MNEVLGLIDSLEATVLEAKKIPMTEKVVLEEQRILTMLDKLRLALKSNGEVVRQSVAVNSSQDLKDKKDAIPLTSEPDEDVTETLQEAVKEADKIRHGANEYADNILANLQLLLTKMQKNFISLERSIESGRDVIETMREKPREGDMDEI